VETGRGLLPVGSREADTLERTAVALNVSADLLLFEPDERVPSDDLKRRFEAASRLADERSALNPPSNPCSSNTNPNAGPPERPSRQALSSRVSRASTYRNPARSSSGRRSNSSRETSTSRGLVFGSSSAYSTRR
jgi:hypothetical protein